MKYFDLKEWRHSHCVNRIEAAETLKPYFPGMDAELLGKAEEPFLYGVELIKEAQDVLRVHYKLRPHIGPDGTPRDSSGHRYTESVKVRMPIEMKLQVKTMIRDMGYDTMQDYLYDLILEDLDKHKSNELDQLGIDTGRMFFDGLD